jgi:hypothetical protein
MAFFLTSIAPIHSEEKCAVAIGQMINECNLFQKNPSLLNLPSNVKSSVSLSVFRDFVSVLERKAIEITIINFAGLLNLWDEFNFEELSTKISEFQNWMSLREMEIRKQIVVVEESVQRCSRDVEMLENKFRDVIRNFEGLMKEVITLKSAIVGTQKLSKKVLTLRKQISGQF